MRNRILVTGYSKIPQGIAAPDIYSVIGVGMEVDVRTSEIIKADCNLLTNLARDFVIKLLVGESLADFSHIEQKLKESYYGSTGSALISSAKVCFDRYLKALENIEN